MNLSLNFLSVAKMAADDYVGFTFFVGCMAMMAASVFFFLSMNSFDKKWRTSILVSGLITFIAAVHYFGDALGKNLGGIFLRSDADSLATEISRAHPRTVRRVRAIPTFEACRQ